VPFARDWVFAAALFGCVWSWVHLGPAWADAWQRFAHSAWSNAGASIASVGASAFELLWRASLWMLAPCVLSWLVIGAQRVGALRLWGAQPKASQPPAHAGASQFATTLLAYARCAVLASVLVWQLRTSLPGLRAAWQLDVSALLPALGRVLEAMVLRAASGLLLLGGVDWTVQGWLRLRRLRMTRRQVLDEQRELVGDPRLMAERSARARNAAALGGEAQLTAAALLVTSERRVIALEYVSGRDLAPSVLLKAEAASAFKLLSQAYALALPLATDAWLTDELYALPVQQAIPEHLHARVATHLAAVQPVRIGSAL
jgi:flagellar biosynthesis protein FlhB